MTATDHDAPLCNCGAPIPEEWHRLGVERCPVCTLHDPEGDER